jgi:O-antigen ligase
MGRNLYILAGALALFAVVSIILSFTGVAHQAGSPADTSLWRTTGIFLFLIALLSALGAVLTSLFEQAERRADTDRIKQRRRRRGLTE